MGVVPSRCDHPQIHASGRVARFGFVARSTGRRRARPRLVQEDREIIAAASAYRVKRPEHVGTRQGAGDGTCGRDRSRPCRRRIRPFATEAVRRRVRALLLSGARP